MSFPIPFSSGSDQMNKLIQSFDWENSVLGQPDEWPYLLKCALLIIRGSKQPMSLCWGTELLHFYNDAFGGAFGPNQLPPALGMPITDKVHALWETLRTRMREVVCEKKSQDSAPFQIQFSDAQTQCDTWWSCTISPILNVDNVRQVDGALAIWSDMTDKKRYFNEARKLDLRLMAETRYRQETEIHQTFKMNLSDALRRSSDAKERAHIALDMTGSFSCADHAFYVQAPGSNQQCVIFQDWHRGGSAQNFPVTGDLIDFGPAVMAQLRDNLSVAIEDLAKDERTVEMVIANMAAEGTSFLISPFLRNKTLVSFFVLALDTPRLWDASEIRAIAQIAERTGNAIEYALEHAKRIRTEQILSVQRSTEYARLYSMFKNAPGFMGLMHGPEHIFEFVNESFSRLIGHRELIGLRARDALHDLVAQDWLNLLDAVYKSGQPYAAIDRVMSLEGSPGVQQVTTYVDFVLQPIIGANGSTSGIFVEGFDVTERTLSKKALEISQQRLKDGMAAAKMVIWDWDLITDQIVFSGAENHFFEHNICPISEIWRHIPPEDLNRLRAARNHALAGEDAYQQVYRVFPDGAQLPKWVQMHGQVDRDRDGNPVAVRGVCIDVTALKQAEQELLDESKRKDKLLAMLAHELRNPLAPIVAAAEILTRANLVEAGLHRASLIVRRQAEHMTSLINDMLDVSRVASGNVVLSKKAVELNEILLDSIEQVRPFIDANSLNFSFSPTSSRGVIVGDRERLIQIFTNLLQNAAKFTPHGGHISLSVQDHGDKIAVIVKDDGVGIDRELLHHVFDLFVQGRERFNRLRGGLGLGLALVKNLVELHGGTISAFSRGTDKGAEFTVRFPRAPLELVVVPAAQTPAESNADADAKRQHILLVDDNEDASALLAFLLEEEGYAVTTAADPFRALEIAQAALPDFFILDIGLPGIDGNELARRLRNIPSSQHIPIIALTGYGQPSDQETAISSGFDHFFVKPAGIDHLLKVMSDIRPKANCD